MKVIKSGEDITTIVNRLVQQALGYSKIENVVFKIENMKKILQKVREKLDLSFHQRLSVESTINSLEYMFHRIQCGVLVSIRKGQLDIFQPFCNSSYVNDWSKEVKSTDKDIINYRQLFTDEYEYCNLGRDKTKWVLNCEEIMDAESFEYKTDILESWKKTLTLLCAEGNIPDVDFFINLNYQPTLKQNLTKHVFLGSTLNNDSVPQLTCQNYTPILSVKGSSAFADILIPSLKDYKIIEKESNNYVTWDNKINVLFFKGCLGAGSKEKNVTLKLFKIYNEWMLAGKNQVLAEDEISSSTSNFSPNILLNIQLTEIKPSYFVDKNGKIGFHKRNEIPQTVVQNTGIELNEDSFKYILCLENNGANTDYAKYMMMKSVIFKVDSTSCAPDLWYFPSLIPYEGNRKDNAEIKENGADHIRINSDLSNLREMILWCRENETKCQILAENAFKKYKTIFLTQNLNKYLKFVLLEVARNFIVLPSFFIYPKKKINSFTGPQTLSCYLDSKRNVSEYCRSCAERQEDYGQANKSAKIVIATEEIKSGKSKKFCRKCRKVVCTCKSGNSTKKLKIAHGDTPSSVRIRLS